MELDERIKKICVYLDEYIQKLDKNDQNVIDFKDSLQWFIDDNTDYKTLPRPVLIKGVWVNGFVSKGHICMYSIMTFQRGGPHQKDPFYLIQQIQSDDKDMIITVRTLSSYMDSFWVLSTMRHADIKYASTNTTMSVGKHANMTDLLTKLKNDCP